MKTEFTLVRNTKGAEIHVRCWASFNYKIGKVNAVFKVTTVLGCGDFDNAMVVTHVDTGSRICDVSWHQIALTRDSDTKNNYRAAGLYAASKALEGMTEERFNKAVKAAWEKINRLS